MALSELDVDSAAAIWASIEALHPAILLGDFELDWGAVGSHWLRGTSSQGTLVADINLALANSLRDPLTILQRASEPCDHAGEISADETLLITTSQSNRTLLRVRNRARIKAPESANALRLACQDPSTESVVVDLRFGGHFDESPCLAGPPELLTQLLPREIAPIFSLTRYCVGPNLLTNFAAHDFQLGPPYQAGLAVSRVLPPCHVTADRSDSKIKPIIVANWDSYSTYRELLFILAAHNCITLIVEPYSRSPWRFSDTIGDGRFYFNLNQRVLFCAGMLEGDACQISSSLRLLSQKQMLTDSFVRSPVVPQRTLENLLLQRPIARLPVADGLLPVATQRCVYARVRNLVTSYFPHCKLADPAWHVSFSDMIQYADEPCTTTQMATGLTASLARLRDSHIVVSGETNFSKLIPHSLWLVEGQVCVMNSAPQATGGLRNGDVIQTINGTSITELLSRLREQISYSSDMGFLLKALDQQMIFRDLTGESVRLGVLRDESFEIVLPLRETARVPSYAPSLKPIDEACSGVYYVDVARLESIESQLELSSQVTAETPRALIFDLRNYPSFHFLEALPDILSGLHIPHLTASARGTLNGRMFQMTAEWKPFIERSSRRVQHIIALIAGTSISWSEHLALRPKLHADAYLVGESTVGTFGEIMEVRPIDGVAFTISGEDFTANNCSYQNRGVQPDLHVRRTISAIREGKDEILQAALSYIDQVDRDSSRG